MVVKKLKSWIYLLILYVDSGIRMIEFIDQIKMFHNIKILSKI